MKAKKKLGRKSLCTPAMQREICELLGAGNNIKTVCAAVGVSERAYFEWCEKHPQFMQATTRARARAKIKLVATISEAGKTDARHAEWLLERGWPNEFGKAWREPAAQDEEARSIPYKLLLNLGGKSLKELTDYPVVEQQHSGDDGEVGDDDGSLNTMLRNGDSP